jgi:hypothetical protein
MEENNDKGKIKMVKLLLKLKDHEFYDLMFCVLVRLGEYCVQIL